jgi:hypothetical protein
MKEDPRLMPSIRGLTKLLFFTHNTMLSVLYTMLRSPTSHHIRAVDEQGAVLNRGAQFRYGIDSQYGDVIFIMKNDFWRELKGAQGRENNITDHATFGHFYKRDFIEYAGAANEFLVQRWMELEAEAFDYRPETEALDGRECKHSTWNVTWCNLQMHIGENVSFHHIEKIYAPAWIVHDTETMAKIADNGLNTTFLRDAVTNNLPFYPHLPPTVPEPNLLNGKFHLYGPKRANDHYHQIEKTRGRFQTREHSGAIYGAVEPSTAFFR